MKRILCFWLIWFLLSTGIASGVELVRQKSQATRILFPITDANGDTVIGCTCDVEYTSWADNGNPGAFANVATNSCTEINNGDAAPSGWYYVNIALGEVASDYTAIKIVPATCSGAKNQRILIRTTVGDPLYLATTDDGGAINVASGVAEADCLKISGVAATADRLEAWFNGFLTGSVVDETPTAASFITNATEASNDHFNHMILSFTGGNLLGQSRRISDYNGTTKMVYVQPAFTEAPANGDTWVLVPIIVGGLDANGRVDVGTWVGTEVTLTGGVPDVNVKSYTNPIGIKKNTATNNFEVQMVLSSNHVTPATGKTVACQRSIDGGAYANCNTTTATEVGSGTYKINLAASDLNGTWISLKFSATDCDTRIITIKTND